MTGSGDQRVKEIEMNLLPDPSVYPQLRLVLPGRRWHLATELRIIKDVANNMENDFLERSIVFNNEAQEKLRKTPGYSREELEEILDEEYFVISESMPIIVRQSLFISIYSLLETYMNDVCDMLKENQKIAISVGDLSGNGIFRAQCYLQKVLNVDFPASHKTWQKISNYNRIRNCLVHSSGQVTDDTNKQLLRFIKNNPLIDLNPIHRIHLQEGFVDEVCDSIESFVNDLTDRMLRRFGP